MRLRFRVRTLMIVVAVVAAGLFALRTRQKWSEFADQASRYDMDERNKLQTAGFYDVEADWYAHLAEIARRGDPCPPTSEWGNSVVSAFAKGPDKLLEIAAEKQFAADQTRLLAANSNRMNRYYRSRWW